MKKILIYIILGFSFIYLLSCTSKDESDFNLICGYFDSLEQDTANHESEPDYKFNYINSRVKAEIPLDHPARIFWDGMINLANAEERYPVFKNGASSQINKSWQCESMERLFKGLLIEDL